MLELGRRCTAAKNKLLSTGAHPGFARTNLQTSGRGKEQNVAQKMMTVARRLWDVSEQLTGVSFSSL